MATGIAVATLQKTKGRSETPGWNLTRGVEESPSPEHDSYLDKYKHLQLRYRLSEDGAGQLCETTTLAFNRGIRRDPLLLISGDRPAFALMITKREDRQDPDLLKLGEGQFSIDGHPLSEHENAHALFEPGGTVWHGDVDQTVSWKMTTRILDNRGQRTELQISNAGVVARKIRVDCTYGGLQRCGRTFDAPYFDPDSADGAHDEVDIKDGIGIFSHTSIPGVSVIAHSNVGEPQILNGKVTWATALDVLPGKTSTSYLVSIWGRSEDEALDFAAHDDTEKAASDTRQHYEEILASAVVRTPDPIIDAGFKASLLNLDYVYAAPPGLRVDTGGRHSGAITTRYRQRFARGRTNGQRRRWRFFPPSRADHIRSYWHRASPACTTPLSVQIHWQDMKTAFPTTSTSFCSTMNTQAIFRS
jgi:hypothetical protein